MEGTSWERQVPGPCMQMARLVPGTGAQGSSAPADGATVRDAGPGDTCPGDPPPASPLLPAHLAGWGHPGAALWVHTPLLSTSRATRVPVTRLGLGNAPGSSAQQRPLTSLQGPQAWPLPQLPSPHAVLEPSRPHLGHVPLSPEPRSAPPSPPRAWAEVSLHQPGPNPGHSHTDRSHGRCLCARLGQSRPSPWSPRDIWKSD